MGRLTTEPGAQAPRIVSAGLPPGYKPDDGQSTPGVVAFFRVYMGYSTLASLGVSGVSVWSIVKHRVHGSPPPSPLEATFYGIFATFMSLAAAAHAIAVVCPRRRWMHAFGTILLGLSLLGGCVPISVALLVFWLKPEVRSWLESEA